MLEITCEFHYEAAHWLPRVRADHKCRNMHGHSYRLTVTVAGEVNELGWVMDFAELRSHVDPVIARLDHRTLNDVIENPTVELQLRWIWDQLDKSGLLVPGRGRLTLRETDTASGSYDGCV